MTRHAAGMPAAPHAADRTANRAQYPPVPRQTPAATARAPHPAVHFAERVGAGRRAMPK